MVKKQAGIIVDEQVLEELYELLSLYFEISLGGNFVKAFGGSKDIEPQLDRVIFKEDVLAKITAIIMEIICS